MSNFRNWYVRNQDVITGFVIGWCTFAGINDLTQGQYIWAGVNFVLAYLNYKLQDFRLQ